MQVNNTKSANDGALRLKIIIVGAYVFIFTLTALIIGSDSTLLNQLVSQLGLILLNDSPSQVKP